MLNDQPNGRPSLGDMLEQSPYTEEELALLRRRAWIEHGIFIVSAFDQRLRVIEARSVCRLAQRLYGHGGE